jgi:solute carrier family 31 (copper transporter), member 1
MDMGTHTHDAMGTSTTMAPGGATPTSSASMDHDMGGMMGGCKISVLFPPSIPRPRRLGTSLTINPQMLWNWNTVDSCFIAESWRITSSGMFAGSCIGVILLVMSLEFLRRAVKEYDRYLVAKNVVADGATSPDSGSAHAKGASTVNVVTQPRGYRPNVFEQLIRAALHMTQFAVAYFIML